MTTDYHAEASQILQQIHQLAAITETPGMITRTYGSDAFITAGEQVFQWMQNAGLQVRKDNMGNIRGRLKSANKAAKTFVIASHIDTVVNAGKFDGPLGVIMGLNVMKRLIENKQSLPFHIELIAFCDEEGVRFHTTYLGSKVVAGSLEPSILQRQDKDGITITNVIKKLNGNIDLLLQDAISKDDFIGYFEIHIEQGPVLYEAHIPVAIVTAIAGQKRIGLTFTGVANHAGTVPMDKRQDALCCAAECVLAIEAFAQQRKDYLVATTGVLNISNAASNVIPGEVICSLDMRSADAEKLAAYCHEAEILLLEICTKRNIQFAWKTIQETQPVLCDKMLQNVMNQSVQEAGYERVELVSGAGHDAVPISALGAVSMLFVRCYKGISHNPLEDVELNDMAAAIAVSDIFIKKLSKHHQS